MEKQLYGFGLPFNAAVGGEQIDRLINLLHVFMAVLFVGWMAFLIYTLIKFRSRPGHKATYHTHHFKAPTYLEVGVAIIEAILLVGFSFPIINQVRNEPPPQNQAFRVRVVAEQFAWNIHYPGKDGKFGKTDPKLISTKNPVGLDETDPAAEDDITTINQLNIPVNTPVIAELSSKDVIHSFALPVMRVKRDVLPGEPVTIWFEAKETGEFEIACAQLCGLGHYRMRGFFNVYTQADYEGWMNKNLEKIEKRRQRELEKQRKRLEQQQAELAKTAETASENLTEATGETVEAAGESMQQTEKEVNQAHESAH